MSRLRVRIGFANSATSPVSETCSSRLPARTTATVGTSVLSPGSTVMPVITCGSPHRRSSIGLRSWGADIQAVLTWPS